MAVTVTMLQTRRGEDGTLWTVGNAYSATDAFATLLVASNYATGTLPAPVQTALSEADKVSVKALVSGAGLVFGNSAAATATANSALLQATLNTRGAVRWFGSGIAWINDTLTIYSDTDLTVDVGLEIKMVSGAGGKPVLHNYAYSQRASKTTVTWTWSSGTAASIAWTAHGLATGDCAWLQGSTLSAFNLIAQQLDTNSASTASDANTLAVELNYIPSGAQSGTATALKCDRNITIRCAGMLNYNQPANTTGTSNLFSCGVHLSLIENLRVYGMNIRDAEKFALNASGLRNAIIQGLDSPVTKSDILHMYGPLQNVQVLGVSGNNGDDGVVVHPYEAPAYPNFQWSRGDCIGVRVRGTNIRTKLVGGSIAVCYPNDVDKCLDVSFEDIGGTTPQGNAVAIIAASSTADVADGINVDGVSAYCRYGLRTGRQNSSVLTVKNLRCNAANFQPRLEGTNGIGFLLDTGSTVAFGDVGVNINDPAFTGGQNAVQVNGNYDYLHVRGSVEGGSTARCVGLFATQTGHLVVSVKKRTGDQLVGGTNVSGTITLMGCDTAIANVISTSGAVGPINVNLVGNRFNNASGGVIRTSTTATWNIKSSGNAWDGSTVPIFATSGTPTFNVYGWDIPIDVGATGFNKTTAGQFAFNNGAARGTLVQNRLVICNGTNWVQSDVLANVF